MAPKYDLINLALDAYDYTEPSDIPTMPPLQHDEEVRKRNRNQNINFKRSINQASSIISTNKCWN